MRSLVAGFGNVLRGDDGFGVEVLKRLAGDGRSRPHVELLEVGTAGLRLAQELLTPYDRLVIVDAMVRGGAPGTVYVTAVDDVEPVGEVDLHLAVPSRALAVARALGGLPREVFIVGCEPAEVDELTMEMTPPVRAAVDEAVEHVRRLLGERDPLESLKRRDEILQVMFWIRGEGLGPDVSPSDILRFVDDEPAVTAALAQLCEDGYVEPVDGSPPTRRYRLTELGIQEGRRTFLDEFEPYLARAGHGECGAADCDCHPGGTDCKSHA